MEVGSFAKIKALSEHPEYSQMVHKLKFFPALLSPDLRCKEDYENCVRSLDWEYGEPSHMHFNADGTLDLSQEDIDAGFEEYCDYYDKQFALRYQSLQPLQAAFEKLHALRHVTTGFVAEILGDHMHWVCCNGIVQEMARKTLMPIICKGWQTQLHDDTDGRLLFRVLAQSECRVHKLNLSSPGGCFDSSFLKFASVCDDECMQKVLEGLGVFSLRLAGRGYEDFEYLIVNGRVAKFLQWAVHVKTLKLNPPMEAEDFATALIARVIRSNHWPCLERLELGFVISGANELKDLLLRHRSTLKMVRFDLAYLSFGTWREVFTSMRQMEKLEDVQVGELVVLDRTAYPPTQTIRTTVSNLDLLNRFILQKGDWSPKLPADYDQVAIVDP